MNGSLGHTNFIDEVAAATRLVDGAVIVVDVVEGVREKKNVYGGSVA